MGDDRDPEDGSVETCRILITQYLLPDGQIGYTIRRSGDANLSSHIGLLELAKIDIVADFRKGEAE